MKRSRQITEKSTMEINCLDKITKEEEIQLHNECCDYKMKDSAIVNVYKHLHCIVQLII